jgi:hypothetical protein
VDNLLKKSYATILSPNGNPEKPVELQYHLPYQLEIFATLTNILNISQVMILVHYFSICFINY